MAQVLGDTGLTLEGAALEADLLTFTMCGNMLWQGSSGRALTAERQCTAKQGGSKISTGTGVLANKHSERWSHISYRRTLNA